MANWLSSMKMKMAKLDNLEARLSRDRVADGQNMPLVLNFTLH